MKPLPTSAGDLMADRRADYAEMLFSSGDRAAAAELMLAALEIAPRWALGWFRLGEMQEAAGRPDEAAEAWAMALLLDPADRPGAALKLALAGRGAAPASPPSAFVEALFDQYADGFDEALVGRLAYRVPELLEAAIRGGHAGRFRLALDLGCGTGLMGARLRPLVERLEGFDISAGMLRKARARGVYDRLGKADLQAFAYAGGRPDLVAAADVFMYLGALEGVVAAVAGLLDPGALFAFSVEKLGLPASERERARQDGAGEDAGAAHEREPKEAAGPPNGFALQPSRRYAHSEAYVRQVLAAHGLAVLSLSEATIRHDRNEPVAGLIVVAGRT